ncbi:IL-1 receptor antagonist [Akhmeta virus]|uniref:IL-1 receptor antagonist n=1 Tax=Orthopoxvirus akhmetapox TaxID=2200830 RepID=A0A346FRB0_9POXV|nr:IL-1 receptor antagonist [Akhmeta virus]AXN74803.1 IL-1 receptor antagonist [Akhmeta virus]AXN75023.1 IL-1 receptor antagonist [Akhmeta virus]QEQ49355.1 IL-1 receptor antagonist [Akhmeta virus]
MDIYDDSGIQTIKLFNNDFDCVRNEIRELFKYVTDSTSIIQHPIDDDSDIIENIRKILYRRLKNVECVDIDNTITFMKYNPDDNNNSKRTCSNWVPLTSNYMEYCLVIYLENPIYGGKIKVYQPTGNIKSDKDIMFAKTLDFKSKKVITGHKTIAILDISISYMRSMMTIQYNDEVGIDIHTDKNGKELCYCYVTIEDHYLVDVETIGVIVDRSGKCLLVNNHLGIVKDKLISNSFSDVCMDTIFGFSEARELFTLTNDDNRNIAWGTDKLDANIDIWTPTTEDDYKFLSKLVLYAKSQSDTVFDYYVLTGDTEPPTVFNFKVTRFYFNMLK